MGNQVNLFGTQKWIIILDLYSVGEGILHYYPFFSFSSNLQKSIKATGMKLSKNVGHCLDDVCCKFDPFWTTPWPRKCAPTTWWAPSRGRPSWPPVVPQW